MAVKTFKPQASIILKKNIGRSFVGEDVAASERFKGSRREIDLMPYLGEDGSIVISKSVRDPAGMFSITLVDRMVEDQQESLYGLIEPMDVIDIRFARDTALYAGQLEKSMPMMMRGIVSSVRRSRVMTLSGPKRAVVITGQDYGKILQIMVVKYIPGYILGQQLLTSFKLALNYGAGSKPYESAGDFIVSIINDVVNPFIAKMREEATGGNASYTSPILDLAVEAKRFGGSVFPFGVNQWPGGAIYELMSYFGDVGPWAEMYVEDREDGPTLVYRPTPFRTIKGDYVQPSDTEPVTVTIYDDWVISDDIQRSDSNVANYYWVSAARYTLIDGALLSAAVNAEGSVGPNVPFQGEYPNSAAELYGFRYMEAASQQGMRIDGQAESEIFEGVDAGIAMIGEKRRALIDMNKDNVVFEDGTLNLRGDERIRAGCYVRLVRGATEESPNEGLAADHYAFSVTHQWSMAGYTTSVTFDRGTGFIERLKRERGINSPYLSEMYLGGSYGR